MRKVLLKERPKASRDTYFFEGAAIFARERPKQTKYFRQVEKCPLKWVNGRSSKFLCRRVTV
jgi:hypothetical protein